MVCLSFSWQQCDVYFFIISLTVSMSSVSIFLTIPVELVEIILDLLDTCTILFSFSQVCRRFHTIAHNYSRLSITFNAESSEADIQRTCRAIQPKNIVALTLKNSSRQWNGIKQFLDSVYFYELTRLRSLTLCDIEEYDLHTIIKSLTLMSTLASLSLSMSKGKILSGDSISLLSTVIALPSLRQLILDVDSQITDKISWPNQCPIHELRVRNYTYKEHNVVLHQLPNLRIFAFHHFNMRSINEFTQQTPYQQLNSFTFSDIQMAIDELESLLSLFPSLVYLKLQMQLPCSIVFLQRFCQWEHFISEKLPLLKKFHFYIYSSCYRYQYVSIESILTSFCTSFWLEQKQWFITGRYTEDNLSPTITIYSSKQSSEYFPDSSNYAAISYSTTTIRNGNLTNKNNQWTARFNPFFMKNIIQGTVCIFLNNSSCK